MERPEFVMSVDPIDPYWLSGFTEGDGSFYVSVALWSRRPAGAQATEKIKLVRTFYSIKLNTRETPLILRIQEYFNYRGSVRLDKVNNLIHYDLVSNKDINEVVLPQFDAFEFYGNKLTNYLICRSR